MMRDDSILLVSDVADMFRVDPKTVTRWVHEGRFPEGAIFRTPGGHRRYRREAVVAMMTELGYPPETLARR